MRIREFTRITWNHVRNGFSEKAYIHGGLDVTRPVSIYGIVNQRCNYRCRYCEFWRPLKPLQEMSIEEWKTALSSLKDYAGPYHIEFSGGEPFLKKGFLDLVEWCHAHHIWWGVTTNGSFFGAQEVQRIVASRPFNINVSIDSHDPEIHDHVRGMAGSLEKITAGLGRLLDARRAAGLTFPIIVKPVVHRLNYRSLPRTVEWLSAMGPVTISFQPVDRYTTEAHHELWIEPQELPDLRATIRELLDMKRSGAPIINPEASLEAFEKHFLGESAPPESLPCRVGLRNYFIRPDGDVEICWFFPPIGNVKHLSAREIWTGPEARKQRERSIQCRKLCLFSCLAQRTLWDKARLALKLMTRSARWLHRKGPSTTPAEPNHS